MKPNVFNKEPELAYAVESLWVYDNRMPPSPKQAQDSRLNPPSPSADIDSGQGVESDGESSRPLMPRRKKQIVLVVSLVFLACWILSVVLIFFEANLLPKGIQWSYWFNNILVGFVAVGFVAICIATIVVSFWLAVTRKRLWLKVILSILGIVAIPATLLATLVSLLFIWGYSDESADFRDDIEFEDGYFYYGKYWLDPEDVPTEVYRLEGLTMRYIRTIPSQTELLNQARGASEARNNQVSQGSWLDSLELSEDMIPSEAPLGFGEFSMGGRITGTDFGVFLVDKAGGSSYQYVFGKRVDGAWKALSEIPCHSGFLSWSRNNSDGAITLVFRDTNGVESSFETVDGFSWREVSSVD